VTCFGTVGCGLVLYELIMVWFSSGMVWYGEARYSMLYCGMDSVVWYGMVWCDMVWEGMVIRHGGYGMV
jgi:hypothetical protein